MIHKIPFSYNSFKARNGHLLLAVPVEDEVETSKAGIVIGKKSVLERPCYGEVVSSGVNDILPGDVVVYPSTDGLDCEFDGKKGFVLLKADSAIGIVKK